MTPSIEANLSVIVDLCREFGVERLELFGSAATDAFDPERSDVDFLVSYPEGYDFGPWLARFQDFEKALSSALGLDVDLVMMSALRNRWFRREAVRTRTLLYASSDAAPVALTREGQEHAICIFQ